MDPRDIDEILRMEKQARDLIEMENKVRRSLDEQRKYQKHSELVEQASVMISARETLRAVEQYKESEPYAEQLKSVLGESASQMLRQAGRILEDLSRYSKPIIDVNKRMHELLGPLLPSSELTNMLMSYQKAMEPVVSAVSRVGSHFPDLSSSQLNVASGYLAAIDMSDTLRRVLGPMEEAAKHVKWLHQVLPTVTINMSFAANQATVNAFAETMELYWDDIEDFEDKEEEERQEIVQGLFWSFADKLIGGIKNLNLDAAAKLNLIGLAISCLSLLVSIFSIYLNSLDMDELKSIEHAHHEEVMHKFKQAEERDNTRQLNARELVKQAVRDVLAERDAEVTGQKAVQKLTCLVKILTPIRQEPSSLEDAVDWVQTGEFVTLLEEKDDWGKIKYFHVSDEKTEYIEGWVAMEYLEKAKTDQTED